MSGTATRSKLLVARARRRAEALMLDECEITEVDSVSTGADGEVSKERSVVYSGRCRLQTYDPYERKVPVGEAEVTLRRDVLQLPVSGTEAVTTGHRVEFTASALDSSIVGREFRVAGPSRKTHQTQRKIYVEEVTQG